MRKFLSPLLFVALPGAVAAQPGPTPPPTPTPTQAPTPTPDVPAPTPPAPAPPTTEPVKVDKALGTAGFDKGFFLKSGDSRYTIKITGRVQPFYNLRILDGVDDDPMVGDTTPADWRHQFEVRRARLTLEGHIHTKRLGYKFQTDFGKGFVTLKDYHADVKLADDVWLRFGQWKRPFSRQQINSSGRLEITDRAITDRGFGGGRDIGIAIRNNYEKSPEIEWIVGVFNGTGDAARVTSTTTIDPVTGAATTTTGLPTNVPAKFMPAIVGRVGLNKNGIKGYQEADLEGGGLRWGAAASVSLEGDFDDNDKSNQKVEVDYIVKSNGLSSTGGLYAMTDQDGDGVLDFEPSLIGFHVQAGYMLVPRHWQVVARYALVEDVRKKDPQPKDQQEITIGGNYYAFGHDAKLAAAVRLIENAAANNPNATFTDEVLVEVGANIGF
jgi:hypothetical protein